MKSAVNKTDYEHVYIYINNQMFNKTIFLCLSAVLFTTALAIEQTLKANWWENLEGA